MDTNKNKSFSYIFIRIIFVLYILGMLVLLFARNNGWMDSYTYAENLRNNFNLIPFRTIRYQIRYIYEYNDAYSSYAAINFIGNIICFIPFGILFPYILKPMRKFIYFLLTTAGLIICVELIQWFTLTGSMDIDDLMLNLIGALIGYAIFWFIFHYRRLNSSDE